MSRAMDSDTRINRYDDFNARIYAISGRILLVAIVVLFTVVLFILGLQIYARCFWQRSLGAARRRRESLRRRRLAFVGGEPDPVRLHRVGLEKSVIEALPVLVYRAENHKEEGGLECAVCLCEFEENEKARLLPKCNHSFHIDCIDMWFDSNSTCPLCRTSARPDEVMPSEADDGPVAVVVIGESSGTGAGEDQVSAISITIDGNREGDVCHSQNRISLRSNSNSIEGTSSPKSMERFVVDIPPRRPDSFSSPRVSMADDQHLVSSGVQSYLKSPTTRLHSLRRILSRVTPQSSDGSSVHIEQGDPAKVEVK